MKGVGRESVASIITSTRLDLIWMLIPEKKCPSVPITHKGRHKIIAENFQKHYFFIFKYILWGKSRGRKCVIIFKSDFVFI